MIVNFISYILTQFTFIFFSALKQTYAVSICARFNRNDINKILYINNNSYTMSNNEQLIQGRPFIVHLTPFSSKNVFSVFRAFLFRYRLRFLFRVLSTPLFERDYTLIRRGPPF